MIHPNGSPLDYFHLVSRHLDSRLMTLVMSFRNAVRLEIIIPSQMEVAPLHCTVDITQKRRLFKNTKETEKM